MILYAADAVDSAIFPPEAGAPLAELSAGVIRPFLLIE